MHDHEAEVVGEGVSDEEPLARVVLEPDLRLAHASFVKESQAATLHF